jgi:purine-nucleoside/S-methyl-5'-thioadenosine phosphorylase / adenosine deaminase
MIRPDGVPGVAFGTVLDGNPRGDADARVSISTSLRIPSEWAWVRQVHGTVVATPSEPGIGVEADALISTNPGLPIAVSVADCLPVALVADHAVGMAHAGWRGVAAGVVPATITAMTERGHPPHTAVIGPGIGPCCFEVGKDVSDRFESHRARTSWGTDSVDLAGAVVDALVGLEVHLVSGCTHHDERFHSFRSDGTRLRQFGVAWVTAD